jgi:hypothetical protein
MNPTVVPGEDEVGATHARPGSRLDGTRDPALTHREEHAISEGSLGLHLSSKKGDLGKAVP